MRSRVVRGVALCAVGAFLLAAPATTRAADAADPVRVTVGTRGTIGSLDPRHGDSPVAREVWALQYPTLTAVDPRTLDPAPGVASGWVPTKDERGWRYTVRKNLAWSDGKPVTADDVVYSLEHARDERWPYAGNTLAGLQARALDDRTVEVSSTSGKPPAPALPLHVVPAHVYSSGPDISSDAKQLGVADGTWHVVALTDDSVQLDAVNGASPAVQQIVFRTYPSGDALIDALAAKQVDAVSGVPAADVDRLEDVPDAGVNHASDGTQYVLRVVSLPGAGTQRALSLAIDRRALVGDAVHGVGTPAAVHAQPALAKTELRALAAATSETPLVVAVPSDETGRRVGERVRDDLAAAGVHTEVGEDGADLVIERVPAGTAAPNEIALFQPDTLQAFRSDNVTGWLRDPERRRLVVFGPTVAQYGQLSAAGTPPREASSNSVYVLGAVIVLVMCGALFWIASQFRRRYATAEETDVSS